MKKKITTTERDFATKPQKNFLDMIAPSVIKFFTDYFICGNTFRCVWALREYPTSTSEQAILRYLGEKDGVRPTAFKNSFSQLVHVYKNIENDLYEQL